MKISNILDRKGGDVVTISSLANLKAAANLMTNHHIAALVVMKGGKVAGVISEREIVEALSHHNDAASLVSVENILPSRLISVTPEETIKRAMSIMTYERVRHLPVIQNGKLIGIVSLGDVVKYRLEELELEGNVLRDIYIAAR